jgi:shikimate 5-dehydrogenase
VRASKKILVQHNGGAKVGAAVALAVAGRHYVMKHHPEEYEKLQKKLERFPLLVT